MAHEPTTDERRALLDAFVADHAGRVAQHRQDVARSATGEQMVRAATHAAKLAGVLAELEMARRLID